MTNQEAIKWVEDRMCHGRYTPTKHNPLVIDDCFKAGEMAIKALEQTADGHEWISVEEKMPEEREWIGTRQFGTTISDEVYVTFKTPSGEYFAKHLSFQNGKLSGFDQQSIDAFHKGSVPIAWMSLPQPWKEDRDDE